MRSSLSLCLILAVGVVFADTPPAGNQQAVQVERLAVTDAVVLDVNKALEIMNEIPAQSVPVAETPAETMSTPTTKVTEIDVPPVRKVNHSKHFRIVSRQRPEVPVAPADTTESAEQ